MIEGRVGSERVDFLGEGTAFGSGKVGSGISSLCEDDFLAVAFPFPFPFPLGAGGLGRIVHRVLTKPTM